SERQECILGFALGLEEPDRLVIPTARKHIEPHCHKIPWHSDFGIRRNYPHDSPFRRAMSEGISPLNAAHRRRACVAGRAGLRQRPLSGRFGVPWQLGLVRVDLAAIRQPYIFASTISASPAEMDAWPGSPVEPRGR